MVEHNGSIQLCGGLNNLKKCFQLDQGTWKEHSTLNARRLWHSAVTTEKATFLFGGTSWTSWNTYEYLPKDSSTWIMGNADIPGGFKDGAAIAVDSQNEIWLIGGSRTKKRILSFNVNDHTFQELPFQLNAERISARCAFIPNTSNIIVTGGYDSKSNHLDSTEIIDTEDGSVTMTTSSMNVQRFGHGMGIVTINGQDRLAVFGGRNYDCLDSIELYNIKTEKWELTDIKLKEPKELFGYLTIKLSKILSKP